MAATEVPPLVGNDCGLYMNNSGDYDTPVWVEIKESSDVTLSDWNVSEAEIVTRASDWAVALAAKFRCAIEFKYLWGADWTILDWLRTSYMSRSWVDIFFSDGDTLLMTMYKVQGLRMPMQIRQLPISQPNEEAATIDTVRMTPTYAYDATTGVRIDPVWYSVTAPPLGTFGEDKVAEELIRRKSRKFEGSGKWIEVPAGELIKAGIKLKHPIPPKRNVIVPDNWESVYIPRKATAQVKG